MANTSHRPTCLSGPGSGSPRSEASEAERGKKKKKEYWTYNTTESKSQTKHDEQIEPGQGMNKYRYGFMTVTPPLRRLLPLLISPRSLSTSVSLQPIKLAPLLPSPPTAWT